MISGKGDIAIRKIADPGFIHPIPTPEDIDRRYSMTVNLQKFAEDVAKQEKGKAEVNIAQILEIQKIIFTKLANMPVSDVEDILRRYR